MVEITETILRVGRKEVIVRPLSPENPTDMAALKDLDKAWVAENPFANEMPEDKRYSKMTPDQLVRFMKGDPDHVMRMVDVNLGSGGEEQKSIGGIYFYNDERVEEAFAVRAKAAREKLGLPSDAKVFEMNFWFDDGTSDTAATAAVGAALEEFRSQPGQKDALIMFADAGDMKDALDGKKTLWEFRNELVRTRAENAFQDTRVLQDLGFAFVGREKYRSKNRVLDFIYGLRLSAAKPPLPIAS